MADQPSEALRAVGWDDRVAALFAELDDRSLRPARVSRVVRSRSFGIDGGGRERALRTTDLLAVGDWVATSESTVRHVLPRWSALTRIDPSGAGVQILAADVDVVVITAPADHLSLARVERELAVAWDSGAQPVVVLTKADLAGAELTADITERLAGVDVLVISASTGSGVDDLRARLRPARTGVLLGPSGAGKSTLANALLGSDDLATGDVREGDSRGRHTTTSRQLVALPGGGVLIDTPGLRSLTLAGDVDVELAFPDIEALATGCRFADCRHEGEPGCAVRAAVAAGTLDRARLASYRKLHGEVRAEAGRSDEAARKEEQRIGRARVAAARRSDDRRHTDDDGDEDDDGDGPPWAAGRRARPRP